MKRIRCILVLMILQFSFSIYSQDIKVDLQPPPPFQFRVEYLWRITLDNTTLNTLEIKLYGEVTSLENNTVIVDATTDIFSIAPGLKVVSANDVSPVQVNERGSNIENILQKTGTFATGSYKICIEARDAATNILLGFDCDSSVTVVQTTKTDLLSPEDNDEILYLLPNFTWLPTSPNQALGKQVTYQLQITEILNRQTAQYAFLANPIYFFSPNTSATLFQYSIAAKPLINGQRYAWKVVTFIDNVKLVESPVWEFLYNGDNRNNLETNKEITKKLNDSISTGSVEESEASGKTYSVSKKGTAGDLPLPKSISTKVDYEFNDITALNSEMPRNFGSINVDIEGAPFNVNLYFDTKEGELKQNLNSLGLYLDPDKIAGEIGIGGKRSGSRSGRISPDNPLSKFFSFFDTFGLGDTYPDYTATTVNGVKMTGADLAINPGMLFLSVSGLNNLDAIPGSTFSRKMLAGRIGVGGKDKSHFHIILMKAWDNPNSLTVDPLTTTVTPMDNIVSGVDAAWSFYKDQISITAAFNGSTLKRDLNAPDLTQEQLDEIGMPQFLINIVDPNMSTQFDLMYEFGSRFTSKDFGTEFEATFKRIGTGYISLAAPNVRPDVQSLDFKLSNPFFKKKLQVAVLYQLEENNLLEVNSSTSKSSKLGFNVRVNFPGYPYLIADYRPNSVSNVSIDSLSKDSVLFKNNSNVLSIVSGMNFNSKSFLNSVNLVLTNFSSSSQIAANDYSILNLVLSNSLTFLKFPLTISGSAGYTKSNGIISSNSIMFDLSGSYTFLDKWNNAFGLSYYTEEKTNTRSSIYFNSSYPIGKFLSVTFNMLKDFYEEEEAVYGNRDNFSIRAGITSTLK